MKFKLWDSIFFVIILICFVAQSILLAIRLDESIQINYFIILIPTYIVALIMIFYGIMKVYYGKLGTQGILLLVIVYTMVLGITISQILFGVKFQNMTTISITECFIPIFLSSAISLFSGLVNIGYVVNQVKKTL